MSTNGVRCHFQYKNGQIEIIKPSVVYPHPERLNSLFAITFIACPLFRLNPKPSAVGITVRINDDLTNMVKIRYDCESHNFLVIYILILFLYRYPSNKKLYKNPQDGIAVCGTPLHNNYKSSLRIVEFVEIHKMLGSTKFYIYNDSSTENVGKVLNFYKTKGILEVLDWHTETGLYTKAPFQF